MAKRKKDGGIDRERDHDKKHEKDEKDEIHGVGHDEDQDDDHVKGIISWTSIAAGTTSYVGTTAADYIYLGGAGATITVSSVEKLSGSAAADVVTLSNAGSTICVSGIDTLSGGTGTDVVTLASRGATITVAGIETLTGGEGVNIVAIASGGVTFNTRGNNNNLTLSTDISADRVVLGKPENIGGVPNTTAYNQIANFQTGIDQLALSGDLRRTIDDNRDGLVSGATAASGGVNLAAAEVFKLTTTAASLTDTDFASVRSAIGGLVNSSASGDAVLLVTDGTNTGAYFVADANGDGAVGATEIKLLGLFKNSASLATTDVGFG